MAQNVISGTVNDSKSNTGIPGVSISIDGASEGTLTDQNGNYKLESTRKFPWNITISSVGYSTIKQTVNANNVPFNISLTEESSQLDEIVVSASRKAEKAQDAPASVSVISSKTLQAASSAIDPIR